jgi:hypothetical protein
VVNGRLAILFPCTAVRIAASGDDREDGPGIRRGIGLAAGLRREPAVAVLHSVEERQSVRDGSRAGTEPDGFESHDGSRRDIDITVAVDIDAPAPIVTLHLLHKVHYVLIDTLFGGHQSQDAPDVVVEQVGITDLGVVLPRHVLHLIQVLQPPDIVLATEVRGVFPCRHNGQNHPSPVSCLERTRARLVFEVRHEVRHRGCLSGSGKSHDRPCGHRKTGYASV